MVRTATAARRWAATLRDHISGPTGERGDTALQMAIVFPLVILLTITVVQAGMWYYARTIALTAAREGAAAGRAYQAGPGAGAARAQATLNRIAGDSLSNTTVSTTGSSTTVTQVTVTGTAPSMLPGIAGLRISQSASGPRERFTTAGP